MNRVVVTGLGMVTPLASGVEPTWRRLLAGESGAARVQGFEVSDIACQIAAQVPRGDAPDAFDPDRFVGNPPDTSLWVPFGGGVNRCVGAAFANMEMLVTLRTLLRRFEFATTDAAGESNHSRGIANAPRRGGRAVVYRRAARAAQVLPV